MNFLEKHKERDIYVLAPLFMTLLRVVGNVKYIFFLTGELRNFRETCLSKAICTLHVIIIRRFSREVD